jgi:tRNA (guanosine-2'-O-)-methyltransferase
MNQLVEYLKQFVTEQRLEKMQEVLSKRTTYCTVVLEDLFQAHNASAVLRSCDGFGIQDVHIIENRNRFKVNTEIALGADQWLNVHRWKSREQNTQTCLTHIKEQGYRLIATSPHHDSVSLEDFDVSKGRFALIFGTELEGISETVSKMADEHLYIPMFGFAESFNISVSAALSLHHLRYKMRDLDIDLTQEEADEVMLQWLKKNIKRSDVLIKEYESRQGPRV